MRATLVFVFSILTTLTFVLAAPVPVADRVSPAERKEAFEFIRNTIAAGLSFGLSRLVLGKFFVKAKALGWRDELTSHSLLGLYIGLGAKQAALRGMLGDAWEDVAGAIGDKLNPGWAAWLEREADEFADWFAGPDVEQALPASSDTQGGEQKQEQKQEQNQEQKEKAPADQQQKDPQWVAWIKQRLDAFVDWYAGPDEQPERPASPGGEKPGSGEEQGENAPPEKRPAEEQPTRNNVLENMSFPRLKIEDLLKGTSKGDSAAPDASNW